MKSLIDTQPKTPKTHATNDGWVDSKTGEILVAIRNLKDRLPVKRGRGRPKKVKDGE